MTPARRCARFDASDQAKHAAARSFAACFALGCLIACSDEPAAPAIESAPQLYLVGPSGTRTTGPLVRSLLPGFGVAIREEVMLGAERMGRTLQGQLLPMRDLKPAQPSAFRGAEIADGRLGFAWVGPQDAYLWSKPEARGQPSAQLSRHARVRLRERAAAPGWIAVEAGFIEASALRVPALAARPNQAARDAPWIDVDVASQTLIAYAGDRAVFATLVSTGAGRPGGVFDTPRGVHRIQHKLRAATMDNLEHSDVIPYSYDVPYTQYFGRYALHGVFWHDRFGTPASHGCINVSLHDAAWLFEFTRPSLASGSTEVRVGGEQGSVLRVR